MHRFITTTKKKASYNLRTVKKFRTDIYNFIFQELKKKLKCLNAINIFCKGLKT